MQVVGSNFSRMPRRQQERLRSCLPHFFHQRRSVWLISTYVRYKLGVAGSGNVAAIGLKTGLEGVWEGAGAKSSPSTRSKMLTINVHNF